MTYGGVEVYFYTLAALPPRKEPPVPVQRLIGPKSWSGHSGEKNIPSQPLPEIEPWLSRL